MDNLKAASELLKMAKSLTRKEVIAAGRDALTYGDIAEGVGSRGVSVDLVERGGKLEVKNHRDAFSIKLHPNGKWEIDTW